MSSAFPHNSILFDIVKVGAQAERVDGDIFSRVTKLGAGAADAVVRVAHGGAWDPFYARRALDVLVSAANGIPSLQAVVDILHKLLSAPLFARVLREQACREIASIRGHGMLDMMLGKAAQVCILRGEFEPSAVLERFCEHVLHRAVISPRGGLSERVDHGVVDLARSLLKPIAHDAAQVFVARPDAKRLGLAGRLPKLTADANLLGEER
ncbi:MAG TPA: hypothetical protein VI072_11245 [Polyangiaceae bacterium]